jgi:hypothetical protein
VNNLGTDVELAKLLQRVIEVDGIKKIQDAITAVCSGEVTAKGSEGLPLKQEPTTGELHVKSV